MKRTLPIVLCTAFAISIAGCSMNSEQMDINSNNSSPIEEVDTTQYNISLSKIVPDPQGLFPDASFTITDPENGDSYQFVLDGGTQEMFSSYVEACKNSGFTEATCDIDTSYQAHTADDEYSVSVSYFPGTEEENFENTYVYVSVKSLSLNTKE